MIVTLLLFFYVALLNVLLAILPTTSGLPAPVAAAFAWIQSSINLFGWILPFDTLLQIVGIVFGIEIVIFSFKWSVWLYNKIRGSG